MTSPAGSTYATKGRLGSHRDLSPEELITWQRTAATWTSTPPWTAKVASDNHQVMVQLASLYEDGVALPTLGEGAGWGYARTNGILHRARLAGITTGIRRYIPTVGQQRLRDKEYRFRDLTADERTTLSTAWAALPVTGATKSWKNPAGYDLLELVEEILAAGVSLAKIAAVLDKCGPTDSAHTGGTVSRQALHQQLSAHRSFS